MFGNTCLHRLWRPGSFFVLFILLCLTQATVSTVKASVFAADQKKQGLETPTLPTGSEITEELKRRIELSVKAENDQTARQMGVTLADLSERTFKLRTILSAYERLITATKKKSSLEEEKATLREKLLAEEQLGITQKPPYSLSFYDLILDDLAAAEQQNETVSLAIKLIKKTREDFSVRLEDAQRDWRALKEKAEAVTKKETDQKLIWNLEKAGLDRELAEANVRLEKAKQEDLILQKELAELRTRFAQRKVAWVRKNLYFDETDLKQQLEILERKRIDLEKRVQELIQGRLNEEEAWVKAQKDAAVTDDEQAGHRAKEASLKEREAWRKTYQVVLEQTEERLRLVAHTEQVWRLRYALVKGEIENEEMKKKREEIESHIDSLDRLMRLQQSQQSNLQSQITALEKQLAAEGQEDQIKAHLENQIKAIKKLAERGLEYTSALLASAQTDRRLLAETDARLDQAGLAEKLIHFKGLLEKIWDFELWVIDTRAVTVKKLILALVILIIGIMITGYLLQVIGRRLLAFTHLRETTASAIQKIFKYFAYLLLLLFALRMVNIPLGAFAFLGGAIAIGVGFGAQNLINNFISGFIMMAERPISINDLIEVEGILGRVEEIGARCTRIVTGENIHILVPNSSFLEKNITNWTLSDRRIRSKVTTGVIYGSPVREVERLLLKAVAEDEKTLKWPEPFVIFNDFGDNALIFDVYFWIHVNQTIERKLIESSIRFRIDGLFREAGIVIAFPQQDVHLDTQGPLELRLIDGKEPENPVDGS